MAEKKYVSFGDLAKAVAEEFAKDMKEFGFDTFTEMCKKLLVGLKRY